MSKIEEYIARAIHDSTIYGYGSTRIMPSWNADWEHASPDEKERALVQARAAILAMGSVIGMKKPLE